MIYSNPYRTILEGTSERGTWLLLLSVHAPIVALVSLNHFTMDFSHLLTKIISLWMFWKTLKDFKTILNFKTDSLHPYFNVLLVSKISQYLVKRSDTSVEFIHSFFHSFIQSVSHSVIHSFIQVFRSNSKWFRKNNDDRIFYRNSI